MTGGDWPKLVEITALVNYSVVVYADSEAQALEHVKTWEHAWDSNADLIAVSDVRVAAVRQGKPEDAHEVAARAAYVRPVGAVLCELCAGRIGRRAEWDEFHCGIRAACDKCGNGGPCAIMPATADGGPQASAPSATSRA